MTDIALHQFAEEDFAIQNREAFDAFIDYWVDGLHPQEAFVRLFGEDQNSHAKCQLMLHNPYAQREFFKRLSEKKVAEMWDEKRAVQQFKAFMQNPFFKDSTRLQALKELNVLMGITEVDDAGRTRKVPTMEDMYGEAEASTGKP